MNIHFLQLGRKNPNFEEHNIGISLVVRYPNNISNDTAYLNFVRFSTGKYWHSSSKCLWFCLLQPQAIDSLLRNCIGSFLHLLQDSDLNVRRVALVAFNSAARNKPSLIRDLLDSLLPNLYHETKVRVRTFLIQYIFSFSFGIVSSTDTHPYFERFCIKIPVWAISYQRPPRLTPTQPLSRNLSQGKKCLLGIDCNLNFGKS